jgi:hypothetical protein
MIRILKIFLVLIISIIQKTLGNQTFSSLETSNCNVTYTESDITISNYNNQSIYCINNIKAPDGYRIVITILELDIPQQTSGYSVCNRNFLFFSPITPTATRVLKLCGQTNETIFNSEKRIISYNSSLNFQFRIDNQMR